MSTQVVTTNTNVRGRRGRIILMFSCSSVIQYIVICIDFCGFSTFLRTTNLCYNRLLVSADRPTDLARSKPTDIVHNVSRQAISPYGKKLGSYRTDIADGRHLKEATAYKAAAP